MGELSIFDFRFSIEGQHSHQSSIKRALRFQSKIKNQKSKISGSGKTGAWKDGEMAQLRPRRVAVVFPIFRGQQLSLAVGHENVRSFFAKDQEPCQGFDKMLQEGACSSR